MDKVYQKPNLLSATGRYNIVLITSTFRKIIKLRDMIWAKHKDVQNTNAILIGNPEGKRTNHIWRHYFFNSLLAIRITLDSIS
jgi:hypothetical protein